MSDQYDRVTLFCRTRAGEALRGVFAYSPTDWSVEYARDDLESAYDGDGLEGLHETVSSVHDEALADAEPVGSPGACRSVVYAFDDAFVAQIGSGPDGGVVVLFDRDVGQTLLEILRECETFLE